MCDPPTCLPKKIHALCNSAGFHSSLPLRATATAKHASALSSHMTKTSQCFALVGLMCSPVSQECLVHAGVQWSFIFITNHFSCALSVRAVGSPTSEAVQTPREMKNMSRMMCPQFWLGEVAQTGHHSRLSAMRVFFVSSDSVVDADSSSRGIGIFDNSSFFFSTSLLLSRTIHPYCCSPSCSCWHAFTSNICELDSVDPSSPRRSQFLVFRE